MTQPATITQPKFKANDIIFIGDNTVAVIGGLEFFGGTEHYGLNYQKANSRSGQFNFGLIPCSIADQIGEEAVLVNVRPKWGVLHSFNKVESMEMLPTCVSVYVRRSELPEGIQVFDVPFYGKDRFRKYNAIMKETYDASFDEARIEVLG